MKKTNVLMIDDNIELVKMVKEYFKDNKEIDVTLTANDGIEGLNLIENNQEDYDVIVLDLIMPNKDGMSVLKDMKEKKLDKKVIVLTSFNTLIPSLLGIIRSRTITS